MSKNSTEACLAFLAILMLQAQFACAEKLVLVAGGTGPVAATVATEAKLNGPFGVDFDRNDNMFLVEMPGNRVRRLSRDGVLAIIGGTGEKGRTGDNGPATSAQLDGPHNIAVARNGDVYVADTWNNCVRKIDAKGIIATIAGTGEKGFGGDGGQASEAKFGGVYCAALDPAGENLYIADLDNRRIRKVNLKTRTVSTVAGNGQKGVPTDGADALSVPLVDPRAVAVDKAGVVYILERSGHALRSVDSAGKIRTIAGTGEKGFSGDDGDARQAKMNGPKHLCLDLENNVIIADTENHVIRKYTPRTQRIVRVVGTGSKGAKGLNGSPLEAELSQPHGVYVHFSGELYIADSSNDRVVKISK